MSNTLMERPTEALSAPNVTTDQLDLIKKTVAMGATPDELKLYLYDCARQGVHPLDRLVFFTKRSGKYTPITSIDFMRIRAAETGEYAGSDDALFWSIETKQSYPDQATVTVWRLVQGQRCAFTATARWAEYKPDANDFMWKKMPHTMLAKCAEALALRKGFPKQLAGLYAREEMDQAGPNQPTAQVVTVTPPELPAADVNRETGEVIEDLPTGTVKILEVTSAPTRKPNITKFTMRLSDGRTVGTIKGQMGALAEQICQAGMPCFLTTKETQWGEDAIDLTPWKSLVGRPPHDANEPPPLTDEDLPL